MAIAEGPLVQAGRDFLKREAGKLGGMLLDKGGAFLKSKLAEKLAQWR
jgi:hypothetical protein